MAVFPTRVVALSPDRAADIWRRLRQQHQELAGYEKPPLAALNEMYVTSEAPLHDGDELAFIPPVAGG